MRASKISIRDAFEVNEKEFLMLSEVGLDQIPTATSFVAFVSERYALSPSGIWYTLKKLKKDGLLDFMEKGEGYKPLSLTSKGVAMLRKHAPVSTSAYEEAVPISTRA